MACYCLQWKCSKKPRCSASGQTAGARSIKPPCRVMTKRQEYAYSFFSPDFLFYKSQSVWKWVHIHKFHFLNCLLAYRYLCPLQHSLDLLMRRTEEKVHLADCVASAEVLQQNSCHFFQTLDTAVAISSNCTTNSSHVPVNHHRSNNLYYHYQLSEGWSMINL